MVPGPFWMPDWIGYLVHGISCAYIIVFVVVYCFPYGTSLTVDGMNYTCVTTGGFTIFIAGWWFWKSNRGYLGPQAFMEEEEDECY
jgi:choline transport protein